MQHVVGEDIYTYRKEVSQKTIDAAKKAGAEAKWKDFAPGKHKTSIKVDNESVRSVLSVLLNFPNGLVENVLPCVGVCVA